MSFTVPSYQERQAAARRSNLRQLCYHEAGHAVAALYFGLSPVISLTRAAGTTLTPGADKLEDWQLVAIKMAGLEAEQLSGARGHTSGHDDIKEAVGITRNRPAIGRRGMVFAEQLFDRAGNAELVAIIARNLELQIELAAVARVDESAILSAETIGNLVYNRRYDERHGGVDVERIAAGKPAIAKARHGGQ